MIFWLDKFQGKAKGGYYLRNDLFKFFQKCKKNNLKPVAIKVDDDWNLEIFMEESEG
uniref:Uncharacterized protein n=1 Tax=viral metagenome TaxID=1070528 RepID=A0A6M3Y240_9ZZZZ